MDDADAHDEDVHRGLSVATGVQNLQPGGDVRVGGVVMGKVLIVEPAITQGDVFDEIHVQFDLDHRVQLYTDAEVLVTAPLIGAGAWLDIPRVGTISKGEPTGGLIRGTEAVGMLNTLLGAGNASRAEEIVENVEAFSEFLASVQGRYDQNYVPIVQEVRATVEEFRATATSTRGIMERVRDEDWPRWGGGG